MTLIEAITQADELAKNPYSRKQKIVWLSRLEAKIKKEVIDAHEGACVYPFTEYDESTPQETVLIMQQPYDECYVHWLQAQVHYANEEIDRYNRSMAMFNALFDDFQSHYKKTHKPKGSGRFRF